MLVALDAGTSGIKAVAFDENGGERLVVRRGIGIDRPRDAWVEQDMNLCWDLVCDSLRTVAARVGAVEFVAVTAQGDGCWLADGNQEAVRPAILWNDGRARGYVEGWREDGTLRRGFGLNGSISFPGLANALLRWLADNDPESLARARHILSCGSWIFSKLTGNARIEISDASAPFLDPRTGRYSDDLLELYGLTAFRDKLPPVVAGQETVSTLSDMAAVATGLPAGTPIVLAPYDVASAALGAGAKEPGDVVLVLGTTFLCGAVTDDPVLDGEPSGLTVALGLPGRFLRLFPTLAGMEVLEWAARLLGRSGPPDLVDLAMTAEAGARGLHFFPYLSPAGERAPFLDPAAKGSLWNLSLQHDPADVARAVVEGLTMVLRDCLMASPQRPSRLYLCGGGSNNAAWRQLVADVTGVEAVRVRASEVTARGAAFFGLIATGRADLHEAAARWKDEGEVSTPDPERAAFHAGNYREFCHLRSLARQGWRRDDSLDAGDRS